MIGILLLVVFVLAFYNGARRGTALQGIHLIGFIISLFIAKNMYEAIGKKIELYVPYMSVTEDTKMVFFTQQQSFDLDHSFYAAFAYICLVILAWFVVKFLAVFFIGLRYTKLFGKFDWIISGLLNVGMVYVLLFFIVFLLALIPIDFLQNLMDKGTIGHFIFKNTPVLSDYYYQMWITDIIG